MEPELDFPHEDTALGFVVEGNCFLSKCDAAVG
ncbi:hypothetical protein FHX15_004200 [Rhizobium sp. BK650]|nr:hypothetical protein [Rhizobium sp. BK650]